MKGTRDDSGEIDPVAFRCLAGHFPTGVTVVTGIDDGGPVGFAVNSFTTVSLRPPLVSFCAALSSTSWPRVRAGGALAVNILRSDQGELCRRFARSGGDKFAQVKWHRSPGGSPLIDGCLGWLDCDVDAEYAAGDHVLVVAGVRHLEVASPNHRPLLFYRSTYHSL